jgi:excisionase family DNA binding protein
MPLLLRPNEAAEPLRIKRSHLYCLLKMERSPLIRVQVGRSARITRASLEAYVKASKRRPDDRAALYAASY